MISRWRSIQLTPAFSTPAFSVAPFPLCTVLPEPLISNSDSCYNFIIFGREKVEISTNKL